MTRRFPSLLAAFLAAILMSTVAWAAAPAAPAAAGPATPVAEKAPAAAPEKEGVSLTVYNQNFGVVRDVRTLAIDEKTGVVRFRDVAKQIDPTSVHFKSLTDPEGTTVTEQNYEFDLVNADKLLDKYIDKKLTVMTKQGKAYEGTLLSFDPAQLVLQGKDGLFMVQRPDNVQNIEFGALPEGLLTRPTLVWKVATEKPGKQLVQVTYQTQGLSWRSDYNVIVNPADTQMDLTGWVTLTNQSGAAYKDAHVKLIAGDVRRIQPPVTPRPMPMARAGGAMAMAAAAPAFEEKPFFEYHMYTLMRPTSVAENEVKQVEYMNVADVPVTKRYVFEPNGRFWHPRYGDPNTFKVNVYIELKNSKESKLGMPLPKGKIRVYKRDAADGQLEFVGEDEIDHTAKDEQLKLYVGDAFDLVGSRTVSDHQQGDRWNQDTIKIDLRNHKDKDDVVIRIREHLSGGQWDISKSEPEYKKIDAQTIEFDVPVKAGGASQAVYTIRYRY